MLEWLKYQIRNYFGFSKTETNGFLVLSFLVLVVFILTPFYSQLFQTKSISSEGDKKLLDSLAQELLTQQNPVISEAGNSNPELFNLKPFNPNLASKEELISLGISKKVASNVVNYRNKGGRFRIKKDFRKIYGLSEEMYTRLHPFIDLPEEYSRSEVKSSPSSKPSFTTSEKRFSKEKQNYDINKADTSELIALKGIGSKLAIRIVKYRDALGGFTSKDQFAEVYGLNEDALNSLNERALITEDFAPQQIEINIADYQTLNKHPYIKPNLANAIVAFRKQHGKFRTIDDLKKIHLADEETISKISPYLLFN